MQTGFPLENSNGWEPLVKDEGGDGRIIRTLPDLTTKWYEAYTRLVTSQ
jgi:hypothetical protein